MARKTSTKRPTAKEMEKIVRPYLMALGRVAFAWNGLQDSLAFLFWKALGIANGGVARTFHIPRASAAEVRAIMVKHASRKSTLHTDEARLYMVPGTEFADHKTINHSRGEYVRGDVHTNTVENVWSVFKRGMHGVYQHCGEAHLHRYLAEFDFRYNRRSALGIGDTERTEDVARGVEGKRLTYRSPDKAAYA